MVGNILTACPGVPRETTTTTSTTTATASTLPLIRRVTQSVRLLIGTIPIVDNPRDREARLGCVVFVSLDPPL